MKYLSNNTKVEIKGEHGEWYLVNINGVEGYVFKNYVKVISGIYPLLRISQSISRV